MASFIERVLHERSKRLQPLLQQARVDLEFLQRPISLTSPSNFNTVTLIPSANGQHISIKVTGPNYHGSRRAYRLMQDDARSRRFKNAVYVKKSTGDMVMSSFVAGGYQENVILPASDEGVDIHSAVAVAQSRAAKIKEWVKKLNVDYPDTWLYHDVEKRNELICKLLGAYLRFSVLCATRYCCSRLRRDIGEHCKRQSLNAPCSPCPKHRVNWLVYISEYDNHTKAIFRSGLLSDTNFIKRHWCKLLCNVARTMVCDVKARFPDLFNYELQCFIGDDDMCCLRHRQYGKRWNDADTDESSGNEEEEAEDEDTIDIVDDEAKNVPLGINRRFFCDDLILQRLFGRPCTSQDRDFIFMYATQGFDETVEEFVNSPTWKVQLPCICYM